VRDLAALEHAAYQRCRKEFLPELFGPVLLGELSQGLAPKPSGRGVAVIYLEAKDPEWALRELAASDTPFDSWYGTQMRRLFGLDLERLPRVAPGELLFTWEERL
jgi:hypothetical protein